MTLTRDLLADAFDRHRERTFGESSLKVYRTTPEDGETVAGTFECGWKGFRVRPTTTGFAEPDSGAWQFQIIAETDWATSQAFLLEAVSLTIDAQRWKVTKLEKPVGVIPVWKIRGQIQ